MRSKIEKTNKVIRQQNNEISRISRAIGTIEDSEDFNHKISELEDKIKQHFININSLIKDFFKP